MNRIVSLVCMTFLVLVPASCLNTSCTVTTETKKVIYLNEVTPTEEASVPMQDDHQKEVTQGLASWYGGKFHGRKIKDGKPFNKNKMSAAHREYPIGSRVLVTNLDNGKSIEVVVTDRGPYAKEGKEYTRDIDLSKEAMRRIGGINRGVIPVLIEVI